MVNAQEWLDNLYPTADAKKEVKRIGPKENAQKRIENDLLSVFTKGRDPLSTLLLSVDSIIKKNHQIDDNLNLEGPLSLKGFFNLEELVISNQKITSLDITDCSKLRDLSLNNNQLKTLDVSNNKQLEELAFDNNQITSLDLTGLTKIEKIFCSGNKLMSLKFLEGLDHTKVLTLRMENNKFPAQDLRFFGRFTNLQRLYIGGNPFYGSLKPLWNLNNLKGIGITNTDIDSGLEYLPEDFFNVNAAATGLGFRGGYFSRSLQCSEKLAEQLKDYKVENDPLRNYDWDAWKRKNQELVDEAKEHNKISQLIFDGAKLIEKNTTGQITDTNQAKIMEVKQALVEALRNQEGIIKKLSTKNQQLQAEIETARSEEKVTNFELQIIKEQLSKNESTIKEKQKILEDLREKIKQLTELTSRINPE